MLVNTLTVRDTIALDVLSGARPRVVSGEDLLDQPIRWMHSSEIFDIAPLLHGGEILITSGLGLVGTSAAQMTSWVTSIFDAGASAVFFEIGRTFPTLPAAILSEARRCGLVIVVLHAVTPFIDVIEAVHRRLLVQEVANRHEQDAFASHFMKVLSDGGGPEEVLTALNVLSGGLHSVLTDASGRLIAHTSGSDLDGAPMRSVAVEVMGEHWGMLEVHGSEEPVHDNVITATIQALALALGRSVHASDRAGLRGEGLILDIASGNYRTIADLAARCSMAGLHRGPGESFVAVAFGVRAAFPRRRVVAAALECGRRTLGSVIAGRVDEDILLVAAARITDETTLRGLVARFITALDAELTSSRESPVLALVASTPVSTFADLSESLNEAREASAIARRLGVRARSLLASDIGVHRLLARLVDDPQLERFVLEQIGPVLEHDARHGTELLPTLDVYFASGLSKTHAAQGLGIRRQTLYNRLERIQAILGGITLDRHERRSAIEIALIAWRLRTSSTFSLQEPIRDRAARDPLLDRTPSR